MLNMTSTCSAGVLGTLFGSAGIGELWLVWFVVLERCQGVFVRPKTSAVAWGLIMVRFGNQQLQTPFDSAGIGEGCREGGHRLLVWTFTLYHAASKHLCSCQNVLQLVTFSASGCCA